MSGFTPGPWKACNKGECPCLQVWCSEYPVAKCFSGEWGDDYPTIKVTGSSLDRKAEAVMEQITYGTIDESEARANAKLIAAAPALLEACKESLLVAEGIGAASLADKLFAAIAQAQGKE